MLLTRVKEAYYRGVLRLHTSNREEAWPVILRTDGIFVVKPTFAMPSKAGLPAMDPKVTFVKIADLSDEFDIRFCPEVTLAKTTIHTIRDAVMSYLAKRKLDHDVDESSLYHVTHNGESGVIAKCIPEDNKNAWIEVEVVTRLGVPYIVSNGGLSNPAFVSGDTIIAMNAPLLDTTLNTTWTFADEETKKCLYKLAHLSEAGQFEPFSPTADVCTTLGGDSRKLLVSVVYSGDVKPEGYVTYPKLELVSRPADAEDGASEEIGYLLAGFVPPYGSRNIQQDGSGSEHYKYVPIGNTIIAIAELAALVEGRVWIEDSHLVALKQRDLKVARLAKRRVVHQTTLMSTSGFPISIRVTTTETDGVFAVCQYRESAYGTTELNPDDLYHIGDLVSSGPNALTLVYTPLTGIVPNLEQLAMSMSRPVYMSPDASAANEDISARTSGFGSMARAQGYGVTQHPHLGGWTNEAPQQGYGYASPLTNHGSPRGYDSYQSHIACSPVANSFYSEVEIPFKHTSRKVRFLGNTAAHLAKAVLTNPGDIYLLDSHAWKPLTEDSVSAIDAILSAVGHSIPVEGLVDTWVSGVSVSVSFFGNTRRTTISIPETDGFIRQVVLTTPAAAFVDIKKYL